MTSADRVLLRARIAFDGARYLEAADRATSVVAIEEGNIMNDQRAEAAYRIARARHQLGQDSLALRHYANALELRGDERSKWAPYSLYYSARIHASRGETTAARDRLEQAIDWPTPYDFSDGLEQMASAALNELDAGA
jgi:tetratricopeptide (TPR) repeat protein